MDTAQAEPIDHGIDVAVADPGEADLEGIDGTADADLGDYPIDTLRIRSEQRTVYDILRRIEKGYFVMNPDFQRDFIWKKDKQSKLIESVLMRIPLPVLYLAEDKEGRMIVVDGLQRLSTFCRFVDDELKLNLPERDSLNKKKFSDLPQRLQNRIEDCNLILYIIDNKVPDQAKLDIFDRVNSGMALTRQQMRNCLYTGQATKFLKDEARTEIFLKATGESLRTETMRDREFVNRFCAFQILPLEDYKLMDSFLTKALQTMNEYGAPAMKSLSSEFRVGLENNYEVFGIHAFRRHADGQIDRGILNASIWDVMSTTLSKVPLRKASERKEEIRHAFFSLLDDNDFLRSVTRGTNDTKAVRTRFGMARDAIGGLLHD